MAKSLHVFRKSVLIEMERQGINQSELARRMKKARSAVNVWLSGTKDPSLSTIDAFADALGTTTPNLLGGVTRPAPAPVAADLLRRIEAMEAAINDLPEAVREDLWSEIDRLLPKGSEQERA